MKLDVLELQYELTDGNIKHLEAAVFLEADKVIKSALLRLNRLFPALRAFFTDWKENCQRDCEPSCC